MADDNITVDVLNMVVAIRMRDALAELVALHDLREKYSRSVPDSPRHPQWGEFRRDIDKLGSRYASAWAAARAALAEQPSVREPLTDEQITRIRVAIADAARYWHLRDDSDPDTCRYYLGSDDPATKFNDPAHVDKQVDTDRANLQARNRATKA